MYVVTCEYINIEKYKNKYNNNGLKLGCLFCEYKLIGRTKMHLWYGKNI